MVQILSNLALDIFDERTRFTDAGIRFLSFGNQDRMPHPEHIGAAISYDVPFDGSRESWHDLHARLPSGFTPDFVLFFWPEQEAVPRDLDQCPFPVVGVMSDYNIALQFTTGLAPFFDVMLCDQGGLGLYRKLGFADVRHWVQFSHNTRIHRPYPDVDWNAQDVAFVGNLHPLVQLGRMPYLARLEALSAHGVRVDIRSGVFGEDYGRVYAGARTGFNRSVRGEMNLRGFEVPACGGVLLMEASNREVRSFFEPGEECVLYADDELEDTVLELLADPKRLREVARAGHARVQHHRMPERILDLVEVLEGLAHTRSNVRASAAARAFGRARAWMQCGIDPHRIVTALVEACDLAPEDPRPLNDLGATLIHASTNEANARRALDLWKKAMRTSPSYVVAAANAATVARHHGAAQTVVRALEEETAARAMRASSLSDFDGVHAAVGARMSSSHCSETNLVHCTALQCALLEDSLDPLREVYAPASIVSAR